MPHLRVVNGGGLDQGQTPPGHKYPALGLAIVVALMNAHLRGVSEKGNTVAHLTCKLMSTLDSGSLDRAS